MWYTNAHNIPHAGQITDTSIKFYHSNLKNILNSTKECYNGRQMDWLIYHLTEEVVAYYWYVVEANMLASFAIRSRKGLQHPQSSKFQPNAILDSNVLICLDDRVAYMESVNNKPKVWAIHEPDFEWAQCNCMIATHGYDLQAYHESFRTVAPWYRR